MKFFSMLMVACGAVASAIAGYTQMTFFQGASGAWIDTGYTPECTDRIEMKVRLTVFSGVQGLFFARSATDNSCSMTALLNGDGKGAYRVRFDRYDDIATTKWTWSNNAFTAADDTNVDHVIVYDGASCQGSVDGSVVTLSSTTNYTVGSTLCLSSMRGANYSTCRFYYCRITGADGTLKHNYVPARDDDATEGSVAQYGVLDTVTGNFITNSGSTAFVADATLPATAIWTGNGDTTSVTDGNNWSCTNVFGVALAAGTVPTYDTEVLIRGRSVKLTCPTAFPHRSHRFGSTTLAADCDWRGLGTLNLTANINLAGHTLRVPDLSGSGTIKDATGYTDLEFIWVTGTQYVRTDIVPNDTDCVETDVRLLGDSTAIQGIWCSRETYQKNNFACLYNPTTVGNDNRTGLLRFDCNKTSNTWALDTPARGTWMHIVANYNTRKVTINGTDACTMADGSFTPPAKLCLFGFGNGEAAPGGLMVGQMRYFKLTDNNGTLRLDLVPRLRNTDNVAGLYDKVNDKFYESSNSNAITPGAVTNSVATSTLHIEIPVDTVCTNTDVLLTGGGLAVVKEGAGTLHQAVLWNTCGGGFRVAEGRVELIQSTSSDPMIYNEQKRLLGCYGAPVTVDAGATLDARGNYCLSYHPISLAGTFANTGLDMDPATNGTWIAQLTGDATIDADATTDIGENLCDLNGHALTLDVASYKTLYLPTCTNGTLILKHGGYVCFNEPREMRTVDLVQQENCALRISAATSVRNYSTCYGIPRNDGTADLNVYGTFTPLTDYFYGVTLQNGATLDLTSRTNVWSTTCAGSVGHRDEVTFADGATITVDVRGRKLKGRTQLISWETTPTNLDTLTFRADATSRETGRYLVTTSDGVYLYHTPTIVILR